MRKVMLFLLAVLAAAVLSACGGSSDSASDKEKSEETAQETEAEPTKEETAASEQITLDLWTYPVGSWGNATRVSNLITDFNREYPEYQVNVEYLDYNTGDEKINEAAEKGELPDLVLEGPERLVANWGEKGWMADLSDLWESETSAQIYDSVREACRHQNGSYYEYPLCMTAHCMAINYDLFEAAGALQYIDEEHRTWTTEDFVHAVEALRAYGQEQAAAVYCGGQGGDQGTRALVNNLYGGRFANEDHTAYVFDSEENVRALQLLKDLEGIQYDASIQGGDEADLFCKGELAMAFCWNVSMEIRQTVNSPNLDFDIFPMTFPTDGGEPILQGGIWGFGIFDHGDELRTEAAKKFIQFICEDEKEYSDAVMTSGYWPVRDLPHLYDNDELMSEYGIFTQYLGDYYQITPGWANVRTAWWTMLQKIGAGEEIPAAVTEFETAANQAAEEAETTGDEL